MSIHQEKEFKWDACSPRAFACFKQALEQLKIQRSLPQLCVITDVYLDNEKHEFTRQKTALRIRCVNKKYEATLKTRTAIKNGLAVREEHTLALPKAVSRKGAISCLAAHGLWQGMDLNSLQVRFMIKNRRVIYGVQYRHCWCEAALDNYVTYAAGKQLHRKEIELELKKGRSSDFEQLITKLSDLCGLPAAKISKVAGAEQWIRCELGLTNF